MCFHSHKMRQIAFKKGFYSIKTKKNNEIVIFLGEIFGGNN